MDTFRAQLWTVRDIRISNQFLITRFSPFRNNYAKRNIKQASLSHWVAEYNLKVSSAWDL